MTVKHDVNGDGVTSSGHIRELFNEVDQNLRRYFAPSECITVDESAAFSREVPVRNVPSQQALKVRDTLIRTVADATHRYM